MPPGAGLLVDGLLPVEALLPAGAPAAPLGEGGETGRVGAFAWAPAEVLKLTQRQIRQVLRVRIARIDSVQFQTCKDKARPTI